VELSGGCPIGHVGESKVKWFFNEAQWPVGRNCISSSVGRGRGRDLRWVSQVGVSHVFWASSLFSALSFGQAEFHRAPGKWPTAGGATGCRYFWEEVRQHQMHLANTHVFEQTHWQHATRIVVHWEELGWDCRMHFLLIKSVIWKPRSRIRLRCSKYSFFSRIYKIFNRQKRLNT